MANEQTVLENNNPEITPSQYFDYIKNAKQTLTNNDVKDSFEVFTKLAEKYKRLGQVESLKKLCFLASTLQKEEKLLELGVSTFVYKDTIEDYIENVADNAVKIVELSRYMREIPDELVDVIEQTRPLFDEFYVLFTDYTGKEERKVQKERRDKDPILFGVFKNRANVADRFYFLGDWVDNFCDLTLDKFVAQYKEKKAIGPTNDITVPTSTEALVELLNSYLPDDKKEFIDLDDQMGEELEDTTIMVPVYKKMWQDTPAKGLINKVRSVFRKK